MTTLEDKYKKHQYNVKFLEKQREKNEIAEPIKKPGRPKKNIDPVLLNSFKPLPRGRPKKQETITIIRSVSVPAKLQSLNNNIPIKAPKSKKNKPIANK